MQVNKTKRYCPPQLTQKALSWLLCNIQVTKPHPYLDTFDNICIMRSCYLYWLPSITFDVRCRQLVPTKAIAARLRERSGFVMFKNDTVFVDRSTKERMVTMVAVEV